MRYTLGQAEAFYWVAKLGSFRAAATQLNLTQPTVSLRVRELERNLGAELLDRSLYRPVMTPAGVAIYAGTKANNDGFMPMGELGRSNTSTWRHF